MYAAACCSPGKDLRYQPLFPFNAQLNRRIHLNYHIITHLHTNQPSFTMKFFLLAAIVAMVGFAVAAPVASPEHAAAKAEDLEKRPVIYASYGCKARREEGENDEPDMVC